MNNAFHTALRARIAKLDVQITELTKKRDACLLLLNEDETTAISAESTSVPKRDKPNRKARPGKRAPAEGSIISVVVDYVKDHPWTDGSAVAAGLGLTKSEATMQLSQGYRAGYLSRREHEGEGRSRWQYKLRFSRETTNGAATQTTETPAP